MAMGVASKRTGGDGSAITLPQNAEQAEDIRPFSSPAQPSHLASTGISVAASMDIATVMPAALAAKLPAGMECVTRPAASARASVRTKRWRIFSASMALTIAIGNIEHQTAVTP